MKVRVYSDIHNEFRKYHTVPYTHNERIPFPYQFTIPPLEDDKNTVLVLAGDIDDNPHSLVDYLERQARLFRHVVYVAGNHEYYGTSMGKVDDMLKEVSNRVKNLTVFHDEHDEPLMIDDVMFVGDTLWTDLDKCNPVVMQAVKRGMNDFNYITTGNGPSEADVRALYDLVVAAPLDEEGPRRLYEEARDDRIANIWSPTLMAAAHEDAKRKILKQLSKKAELNPRRVIMVSHHVPHFIAQSRYEKGACHGTGICDYAYYCTDMEDILAEVDVVIHGHTHDVGVFTWNHLTFIANAVGYYNHEHTEYEDKVFNL